MQTPDKKMRLFLDMQEHPENYAEEQIVAMMDEVDSTPDVEATWQRFKQNHDTTTRHASHRWLKVAASTMGVIMTAAIAYAAIHFVRLHQVSQTCQAEQSASATVAVNTAPADTLATDTIAMEPRIFDNMPLDTMLMEMADYYHVAVEFQRDDCRQLRLHFEWKRSESLVRVVGRLNNFEAVNIVQEPEKLIVK